MTFEEYFEYMLLMAKKEKDNEIVQKLETIAKGYIEYKKRINKEEK